MLRNSASAKGRVVMTMYRLGKLLPPGLRRLYKPLYYCVVDMALGISLPFEARVGAGLRLRHGQGLVVSWQSTIGEDCELHQHVTLGEKNGKAPHVGARVVIGANAVVIGDVRIGDDVQVGAGAVVLQDVPAGATAVGNPARIILRAVPRQ